MIHIYTVQFLCNQPILISRATPGQVRLIPKTFGNCGTTILQVRYPRCGHKAEEILKMVFLTGDSMLPLCYHYDPEHFNDYVGCLAVQHPPITTGVLLTRCHGEPRALLCQRLDALRVAQSTALKELTAYNTVNTINLKTYKILRIVSIHVCDYVYKIQHHSNTILTVMKQ